MGFKIAIITADATNQAPINTASMLAELGHTADIFHELTVDNSNLMSYDIIMPLRYTSAVDSTEATTKYATLDYYMDTVKKPFIIGQAILTQSSSTAQYTFAEHRGVISKEFTSGTGVLESSLEVASTTHYITTTTGNVLGKTYGVRSVEQVNASPDIMSYNYSGSTYSGVAVANKQGSTTSTNVVALDFNTTSLTSKVNAKRVVFIGFLYGRLGYTNGGKQWIQSSMQYVLEYDLNGGNYKGSFNYGTTKSPYESGARILTLNGIDIPEYVKVNAVKVSILPPLENNLLKVRGKKGRHFLGQEFGERMITADISIIADAPNTVIPLVRDLATWLYYDTPVTLSILDEPDKYYIVLPDGDTDIEEIVKVGKGTLQFICTEPYAYGTEKTVTFSPVDDNPVQIDVTGSAETSPLIELTVKEAISSIAVVNSDRFVMIGESGTVETTNTNPKPRVLWDEMTSTATWTTATAVDSGVVAGAFSTDGYKFTATYGTGTAWHGASAIKSLTTPISDFEIEFWLGFKSNVGTEVGRIEVYCLDANNTQFGKVGFKDTSTTYRHQQLEARAGVSGAVGTKMFASEWGNYKGVWSDFQRGHIILGRKGSKWYVSIGIYDNTKKIFHTRLYKEWIDVSGTTLSHQLAKIQIHIAQYGTVTPYSTMYIEDVKVFQHVELGSASVPLIADSGDVLLIDNEKAIIYKNGVPFYEGLNPVSQFFNLKEGANGIAITPAKADVKVTYKERWL